jgi:hypothetical protein
MVPDTDYQARVFAVNCQGNVSESSPVMSFTTLHRSENQEQLTPRNVTSTFTIECTGDICVGDTILMTERLFAKTNGSGADAGLLGASGVRSVASRGSVATVRMDMSVTSVQSNPNAPLPGEFLGERTIAAYVTKDNYRTIRDELVAQGITPREVRKFGKQRKLWLEVVWQRSSTDACKPYELKPGSVIERMQAHLEQFEVNRCTAYCTLIHCCYSSCSCWSDMVIFFSLFFSGVPVPVAI